MAALVRQSSHNLTTRSPHLATQIGVYDRCFPTGQNAVRATLPILFILVFVNASSADQASVARLDGSTITGELKSWNDKQVVLATSDGEKHIPTDELLSLRWAAAPTADSATTMSSVAELTDGSVIPIVEFTSEGARAELKVVGPTSTDAETVKLPKKQLAAVRLRPFNDALTEQWNEIRASKPPADVLVVLKSGGTSLDYHEGVLGDVWPERVEFKVDEDEIKVPREKVAGFIYFRRDAAREIDPKFVAHGRGGLKVNVTAARLVDGSMQLTTTHGAALSWPLDDIYLADFSAGKVVYLSDLDPASNKFTPLVAIPAGATLANEYGEPRRDQSAYGGPLTLAWPEELKTSPAAAKNTFAKGLAVRSRTELVYRLPAGYRRLSMVAGIEPAARTAGNVKLEISGDDRPLIVSEIDGRDAPSSFDVDIEGVKRLKITIDYGQNLDTGDWLNLCDLKLVK
jgi:hypothetical protein